MGLAERTTGGPSDASLISGVLAKAYAACPVPAWLQLVAQCPDLRDQDVGLQRMWRDVRDVAGSADVRESQKDFTRLFFDPQGAPCPPWESLWRQPPQPLMGPIHQSVLEFYARAGLRPRSADREPVDHIGLEFAFLSAVSARIARHGSEREPYVDFWHKHIDAWIHQLALRMGDEACTPFFRIIARLTLAVT